MPCGVQQVVVHRQGLLADPTLLAPQHTEYQAQLHGEHKAFSKAVDGGVLAALALAFELLPCEVICTEF